LFNETTMHDDLIILILLSLPLLCVFAAGFWGIQALVDALLKRMAQRKRRAFPFSKFLGYDLALVTERFSRNHAEMPVSADEIRAQFLRYFYLIAKNPGVQFGMQSKLVDAYWHEFLCCTVMYREFCNEFVGRFVEHDPKGGSARSYARTWLAYKATFGSEPPHMLWPLPEQQEVDALRVQPKNRSAGDDDIATDALLIYSMSDGGGGHDAQTHSHSHGCDGHGCGHGCGGH
jgi:hypothetical protein